MSEWYVRFININDTIWYNCDGGFNSGKDGGVETDKTKAVAKRVVVQTHP